MTDLSSEEAKTDWVKQRRDALDACGMDASVLKGKSLGIAFSGGGIRSATISLGIAQALARHERLLSFDYMSTVSGGGYFGSFLRSLFISDRDRGPEPELIGEPLDRFAFAVKTLESLPSERHITYDDGATKREIINPIWWLRDHSRYLAPNGPTDFAFALSHIARNWLAMLYVFAIAIAAFFAITLMISALLGRVLMRNFPDETKKAIDYLIVGGWTLSPLIMPTLVLLFLSLSVGIAFWITEGMQANSPWRTKSMDNPPFGKAPRDIFARTWLATLFAGVVLVAVLTQFRPDPHFPGAGVAQQCTKVLQWLPIDCAGSFVRSLPSLGKHMLAFGYAFVAAMLLWSIAGYARTMATLRGVRQEGQPDAGWNPTLNLRRLLTDWLSKINQLTLAVFALAVIDTLAIWLCDTNRLPLDATGSARYFSTLLLPVGAYLIKKLPDWFGGKKGTFRITARILPVLSLVVGAGLFAITAILIDGLVHRAAWKGLVINGPFDWVTFGPFAVVIVFLCYLTGRSHGFINLSSLHGYYSSRLTRAYLGATNLGRLMVATPDRAARIEDPLAAKAPVNINWAGDYIDLGIYQRANVPAPIHLINVTLNQTIGASDLVDRARKGALMTFAPEGVLVTAREDSAVPAANWARLAGKQAESLTAGQLCAISGAAASAGMGRMTTLGGALAFTFANVRLGYWWSTGGAFDVETTAATSDQAKPPFSFGRSIKSGWIAAKDSIIPHIATFIYLINEMTARYSRKYRRWYLSDGGHFENSGALELVRRGMQVAIVSDNGADPGLAFGDLEILIRTARLDLGRNIEVASMGDVTEFMSNDAASMFFNGVSDDWRGAAHDPASSAFALLLNVTASINNTDTQRVGRIIWLKPRRIAGVSEDVIGYASAHPDFPHETTGDQFFDEAQWESYRRLGVEMGNRLISRWATVDDWIPAIRPKKRQS